MASVTLKCEAGVWVAGFTEKVFQGTEYCFWTGISQPFNAILGWVRRWLSGTVSIVVVRHSSKGELGPVE